jgi:RHS repeat-associated protein
MTEKLDGGGYTYYSYDECNRLVTVIEPRISRTEYTYDAAGNRASETVSDLSSQLSVLTYAYDQRNRLIQTEKDTGDGTLEYTDFCYDDNGNMLSRLVSRTHDPDGPEALAIDPESEDYALYTYDAWNNMASAETAGERAVYAYNGEGLRTSKTSEGLTTYYGYEYTEIVLEVDEQGGQVAFNLRGINLIARTADSGTVYYLYNGHRDVVMLIDDLGVVVARYKYDAFGVITEESGEFGNPFRYSGYFYDSETMLYYLKSRYYDAGIARFLTEDTYRGQQDDPLSLNLYAYVANNPLIYWDPTGHESRKVNVITPDGIVQADYENKTTTLNGKTPPVGSIVCLDSGYWQVR